MPAPFGQQPAPDERRASPGQQAPAASSADPFAAASPAAASNEVRLVIDDKSDVTAAEVGRKSGAKILVAAVAALALGVAVGWMVGSTVGDRKLYELVLADAKEIYAKVNEASGTVSTAQSLVKQALEAAKPGAGKGAVADFKALEDLRALEKPFEAGAFSRKHYRAFNAGTVDALFRYYNNINLAWAKIQSLSASTLTEANRKALEKSAKAATDFASQQYGCVPFSQNNQMGCGMVSIGPSEKENLVKVTSHGRSFDKIPFGGQDLSKNPSNFVILIDKGRSKEFLGQGGNKFLDYARDLGELGTLLQETTEVQGQLIRDIGQAIAK